MSEWEVQKSADISECGTYRYRLERWWAEAPAMSLGMLNPSKADAICEDPTIRRCIGFAQDWGYGGLIVWNLFALRSSDPRALRRHPDPVGPENDRHIVQAVLDPRSGLTLVAWGTKGGDRAREVLDMLASFGKRPHCLGLTKGGHPRHPLYVKADTQPVPFAPLGAHREA